MATIMELRTKRANLWEGAKAFLDSHRDKEDKLSPEDAAVYDKMETDVVALGKEIERMERQAAIDAELAKPTAEPIVNKPNAETSKEKVGRASDEYHKAMIAAIRSNFRNVSNVMQEGVDADGGYLVPTELDSRFVDVLDEENIMRSLGTKLTTSGERKINIAATRPAASWIEEGGALTFGDATFDQIILDAYKLHVAIKVTEELLYDNVFRLENYIIEQFGKALANAEEDAFLNGDGSHKPLGLFVKVVDSTTGAMKNSTYSTEVSTKTGNVPDLKTDDILSLIYSLKRPYCKNASFIMNDKTLATIRKLKDGNSLRQSRQQLIVSSVSLGEMP